MSISPKNEASQNNTAKRRDYISWDEYFMGIAMLSAMRSKDPNSQVGACIVRDNKILSLGYNGMPIGCDDDIMPWGREGNELETKYMYVCHSELNAILNAGKDLHGSTMYVTLYPCNEYAKAIIQSGIKPCNCRLLLRTTYYAPVAELAYAADSNSVFSGFNSRLEYHFLKLTQR